AVAHHLGRNRRTCRRPGSWRSRPRRAQQLGAGARGGGPSDEHVRNMRRTAMPPTATTTLRKEPGSLSGNGARLVPPARQRSIPLAVLGVLLCFVGALVFGALHLRLDSRTAVLAVARPVAAGQVIRDSDLRVVRVSADGIDTISEGDRSSVVGHVAAVPLVPGGLLIRSEMGAAASLTAGKAVVGLA